jgi:hypothetical protein
MRPLRRPVGEHVAFRTWRIVLRECAEAGGHSLPMRAGAEPRQRRNKCERHSARKWRRAR